MAAKTEAAQASTEPRLDWDYLYGGWSAVCGFLILAVTWDKGAYHCRIGDRRLKQTFTDPARARLHAEATAAKWLKDMMAKLEAPATTTEGGSSND